MAEETILTALEKTKKEARAAADAAVAEKVTHYKETLLKAHLSSPQRGAGGTPPGCLDPITLTAAEIKAISAAKASKVDPEKGNQDTVDICREYLAGNKEAAADFKSRC